ncbi:hypothetical protein LEMLEM_LOCUS4116, partial [Lemmus lemmus]
NEQKTVVWSYLSPINYWLLPASSLSVRGATLEAGTKVLASRSLPWLPSMDSDPGDASRVNLLLEPSYHRNRS